jgi:hypothetical protein
MIRGLLVLTFLVEVVLTAASRLEIDSSSGALRNESRSGSKTSTSAVEVDASPSRKDVLRPDTMRERVWPRIDAAEEEEEGEMGACAGPSDAAWWWW